MSISGNLVGSYSQIGKTFVICDEDGNEVTAVVTDQEQIFTATDNDVREGFVYASESGVSTGTKIIPNYYTVAGTRKINSGKPFTIPIYQQPDLYDFTEMQAIICLYENTMAESLATKQVSIKGKVYNIDSSIVQSIVSKDDANRAIDFGFINNDENNYVVRYFLYKEVY